MFKPMFLPPRHHPLVYRFACAGMPLLAHAVGNLRDVRVAPEDLQRLRSLAPHRAILSPNHPTTTDPIVMFWLSRLAGQRFNFMAAREVLEGFQGRLLNQLGVYSVIRGVPDREAIRTTRQLLAQEDRKIVIFPEGDVYEHNDTLLAFQSGVVQMGFWALDDLEKLGKQPFLPIVPVAIKYRCADSPRPAIENGLAELEKTLGLQGAPKATAYERLRRIGDRVLTSLEKDEGLKPSEGGDFRERIPLVRQKMLNRIAQAIGTKVDERSAPADQLHLLAHEIRTWVGEPTADASDYDERLHRRKMEVAAPLFRDLQRLQNFIAVTGDYVAAEPTAERFLETLGRLELEVLGRVKHRIPREALVRIAEPIHLHERAGEYRKNKRQVVADTTRELETRIREMLGELSRESTPFSLDE